MKQRRPIGFSGDEKPRRVGFLLSAEARRRLVEFARRTNTTQGSVIEDAVMAHTAAIASEEARGEGEVVAEAA